MLAVCPGWTRSWPSQEVSVRVLLVAALLALGMSLPVHAQNVVVMNNAGMRDTGGKGERISVSFQLAMPVATPASTVDWTNAMQAANNTLYAIVDQECDVLSVSLKGDCRLVQISNNGNLNGRTNTGESTVNMTVNATYEISPKSVPETVVPPK